MDIFAILMWPIKWVLEAILVGFHSAIDALGIDPASGLAWALSIVGLVLVVRTAMIPLTVRQVKSMRKSLEVAPEIQKIQAKYRGKKDQFSREAMSRETMEVYKRAGTNPFASCLPMLVQMPIFFGLVTVLNEANKGNAGVGLMSEALAEQFGASSFFGVIPLHMTMEQGFAAGNWPVIIVAGVMIIVMTTLQLITQLQIMSKNQTQAMRESPMYKQQRIMLYIIPVFLIISGWLFPLGTMIYWLISNTYTMVQQFIIIRNMPTPGSQAAAEREARIARARQRKGLPPLEDEEATNDLVVPDVNTQRQQPRSKGSKKQRQQRDES